MELNSPLQVGEDEDLETTASPLTSQTPESNTKHVGGVEIEDNSKVTLHRSLGIPGGVSLLVGCIIGSGIFATPSYVMQYTGSVGLNLVVWAIGGLISIFGGLCYVELGLMIPKSGGEYEYLLEAFGPLPAFLFAWVYAIFIKNTVIVILLLVFAAYIIEPFFPGCSGREDLAHLTKLIAAVGLGVVMLINCASVKWASRVQVGFTVAKMVAIVMLIITGLVRLAQGNVSNFANAFEGSETSFGMIGFAFYNVLFAYEGWNSVNCVVEELKNPKRNLPLSIWIALPIVTSSYVLVNIGYLTVLSPTELQASNAVAATLATHLYGVMAWIIPFLVVCSVFGAVNGCAFTGGRLTYAAARNGHLPRLLAMIHTKKRTPLPALIFSTIICILMMLPDVATFSSLLNYLSFLLWVNYGATISALLWMRYKKRDLHRPYKVFLPIPCLMLVLSIYFVVAPFYEKPVASAYALVILLAGIPLYLLFVKYRVLPKAFYQTIDRGTSWLQKVLDVTLPES